MIHATCVTWRKNCKAYETPRSSLSSIHCSSSLSSHMPTLLSVHTHTHNTSPGQKIANCLWNSDGLFKGQRTAEFYHLSMKRKKLNQGYRFFHSHKSYNELPLNQTISDIEALMVYTAWENFYECGHILKYKTIQFLTLLFSWILYYTYTLCRVLKDS